MARASSLRRRVVRRLRRGRAGSQEAWETKWASRGAARSQAPTPLETMPAYINAAIDSGWFRASGTLIDIGCGSGELAAMFFKRGFRSLGIDFAPSAIELAQATHTELLEPAGLQFEVADVCADVSGLGSFDNLVDRGCFHCLSTQCYAAYARNISALSSEGSRFLMVTGVGRIPRSERESTVRQALEPSFQIDDVTDGAEDGGLAFWMTRR